MTLILAFEDALTDLRISGCVLLHESYASPWAIEVPEETELQSAMGVAQNVRVVPFHLVRRGSFELIHGKSETLAVRSRDVAICPGGARHLMRRGDATEPMSLRRILAGEKLSSHDPLSTEVTELTCGVFLLRTTPLNPLLAALPSILKVATTDPETNPLLVHVSEMLLLEAHRSHGLVGSFTAARLLEIFCAEILRAYQASLTEPSTGWLRGLADVKIARALSLVHADTGASWSVEQLADAVALSPSRFAARFRDTMGETVMAYVTRWRLVRACRLLENPAETIEQIATQLGYAAASSFSRAFKASLGISPAEWRQSMIPKNVS